MRDGINIGGGGMQIARELTDEDIQEALAPKGSVAPAIKKLRFSHHLLAQKLAEGKSPADCQRLTGYSASRISILQADPAFRDLVEHYHARVVEAFEEAQHRAAALAVDALDELSERLDEKPESFKNGDLLALAGDLLDRTILPKKGGPAVKISLGDPGSAKDVAAEVAKIFGRPAQAQIELTPTPTLSLEISDADYQEVSPGPAPQGDGSPEGGENREGEAPSGQGSGQEVGEQG